MGAPRLEPRPEDAERQGEPAQTGGLGTIGERGGSRVTHLGSVVTWLGCWRAGAGQRLTFTVVPHPGVEAGQLLRRQLRGARWAEQGYPARCALLLPAARGIAPGEEAQNPVQAQDRPS